jgi:hypothetical protein
MRGINHAAALIMLGWTFGTPAVGQDDCLASYKVDPSKSVTYLSIGSTTGDRIDTKMSCSVAEAMRDEFFLAAKMLDPHAFDNAVQLRSKISEIKKRLADGKSALKDATIGVAHFSAVLNLKEPILAAGLTSATVGCVVSAEACKPAVRASVALYELAVSASKVGDLAQAREQAERKLSTLESMLQSIPAQLNDNIVQQSKLRFNVVLSEMCRTIKQQCK